MKYDSIDDAISAAIKRESETGIVQFIVRMNKERKPRVFSMAEMHTLRRAGNVFDIHSAF